MNNKANIYLAVLAVVMLACVPFFGEAALTSGSPVHTHSGVTTGGATLQTSTITTGTLAVTPSAPAVTSPYTAAFTAFAGGKYNGGASLTYYDTATVGARLFLLGDADNSFYLDTTGTSLQLRGPTIDGADNLQLDLCPADTCTGTRSASISMYGNESGSPGILALRSGATGNIQLVGGAATLSLDGITGRLTSNLTCASGYTRQGVDYCEKDTVDWTAMTRDTCVTLDLPATATRIDLRLATVANSNNATGIRFGEIDAYTTSACSVTALTWLSQALTYEVTAVAAGTTIAKDINSATVALDANGDLFIKLLDDTGNQGAGHYAIHGYYD